MWVFTQHGAYSVVAYDPHRDSGGEDKPSAGTHLLIRARSRGDIEALGRWLRDIDILEDRAADYRYRAVVSRADWDKAMVGEAAMVDYSTDFKGRVGQIVGQNREAIYTQVWATLRRIDSSSNEA